MVLARATIDWGPPPSLATLAPPMPCWETRRERESSTSRRHRGQRDRLPPGGRARVPLGLAELLNGSRTSRTGCARELFDFAIAELGEMRMRPALDRALKVRARAGNAGDDGIERPPRGRGLAAPCSGQDHKEIAEALVVSPRTVRRFTLHIYAKISGSVDAVGYAANHGVFANTYIDTSAHR